MSQLITIEGFNIGSSPVPQLKYFGSDPVPVPVTRNTDKRGNVASKKYINPAILSDGELALKLLAQRLDIKQQYYGDPGGVYSASRDIINLASGDLHNFSRSKLTGNIPNEVKGIVNAIEQAKSKTTNAQRSQNIRGIRGFDPFGDDPIFTAEDVCGPIWDQLKAKEDQLYAHPQFDDRYFEPFYTGSIPAVIRQLITQADNLQAQYNDCIGNTQLINLLNERLEDSAHCFTYAYLSNSELNSVTTSTVSQKSFYHKTAMFKLAGMVNVSEDNLALWVNNGIMRSNTQAGTDPWNGSASSYAIKYKYQQENRTTVGVPFPVVAAGIIKILSALTAAIGAIALLVNGLTPDQNANLEANIPPPDSLLFTPNIDDWDGAPVGGGNGGTDTPNNGNNNTPLLIGGGILAALLLKK